MRNLVYSSFSISFYITLDYTILDEITKLKKQGFVYYKYKNKKEKLKAEKREKEERQRHKEKEQKEREMYVVKPRSESE